ncbi:MAG: hypothetical protein PHC68_17655 [Syntrophorhabdaceae bacterium]|nr:hypothetical protein [Syntrophorhabdaceae bacterium]
MKPDLQTHPKEWEEWWKRHHAHAKVEHFYKTHRKEITWGEEYIAPKKSFGTWIEIRMIRDESDPIIYHETWDFNKPLPEAVTREIMKVLRNTLDIFNDEEYGFCTPYIIEIDDKGKCHLLTAQWKDGNMRNLDLIMRTGRMEWVKGEPDN